MTGVNIPILASVFPSSWHGDLTQVSPGVATHSQGGNPGWICHAVPLMKISWLVIWYSAKCLKSFALFKLSPYFTPRHQGGRATASVWFQFHSSPAALGYLSLIWLGAANLPFIRWWHNRKYANTIWGGGRACTLKRPCKIKSKTERSQKKPLGSFCSMISYQRLF